MPSPKLLKRSRSWLCFCYIDMLSTVLIYVHVFALLVCTCKHDHGSTLLGLQLHESFLYFFVTETGNVVSLLHPPPHALLGTAW